jgi:hypothetical protein
MKSKEIGAKDSFSMGCACQAAQLPDRGRQRWVNQQMGFGIVQPARINQQFRVVNAYMLDYKQWFFLRFPSNSQSPALFKGYHLGALASTHPSLGGFLPPGCFDHRGDHGRAQRRSSVWGWCETLGAGWSPEKEDLRTPRKFSDLKWGLRTWNGGEKGFSHS